MLKFIQDEIKKLSSLLLLLQNDQQFHKQIATIADYCVAALRDDKKIMLAGNGGSAADAQHLATELVTRLHYERPGLAAIALTTDTSTLTGAGNDYAFDKIFSRQIAALGKSGDVFIGISTSGQSPNILRAFEVARDKKIKTIGMTGSNCAAFAARCDDVLSIPSKETQKIQECHIMIGHILCGIIEEIIFGAKYNPALQSQSEVAFVSS